VATLAVLGEDWANLLLEKLLLRGLGGRPHRSEKLFPLAGLSQNWRRGAINSSPHGPRLRGGQA